MALYSLKFISDQLEDMMQRVIAGEVLSDEDYEVIDKLTDNRTKKLEGYGKFIKSLKAESESLQNEEKKLCAKRKTINNTMDILKQNLLFDMNRHDEKKASAGTVKITVVSQKPSVNVWDPELLHKVKPELVRVIMEYKPDKVMLNTILNETGEIFSGTELIDNKQYLKIY